ncbi:MAG: hypothetical protein QF831_04160 [Candidatus Thalassarchaeaceae archaeon]|nr:hypothetical protein [Candidatus Thalassarchaeaceae archaeon]
MARKKKGLGGFLGSLTGTPYDRLSRHIEKTEENTEIEELGRELNKISKIIRREYDQENIDEEEHDILIEAIEEVHPEGRTFSKLQSDTEEAFDADNMPDAPEPELGGPVNLDELMRANSDSSQGSWGSSEYDDYKRQMAEEFYKDSDEAIASGDHDQMVSQDPVAGRVFHDVEDTAVEVKKEIRREQGEDVEEEEEPDDEDYYVDDDNVEWWRDDDGQWWYRTPGNDDWYPSD